MVGNFIIRHDCNSLSCYLKRLIKSMAIKTLLSIAVTLILFSCTNGIREKEEAYIRLRIDLHNEVFFEFLKDSINISMKSLDSAYQKGKIKYKVSKQSDSIAAVLSRNTNAIYNPDLDDHLTFQKFMTYCKQNNIEPVKAAIRLTVK